MSEIADVMEKRVTISSVLIGLRKRYPALFKSRSQPKLPLKIGIKEELLQPGRLDGILPADMDEEERERIISSAIRIYTQDPQYLSALAAGGPRYGLDGQPDGEIKHASIKHAADRRPIPVEVEVKSFKLVVAVKVDSLPPAQPEEKPQPDMLLRLRTPSGDFVTARIKGKTYRKALREAPPGATVSVQGRLSGEEIIDAGLVYAPFTPK